MKPRCVICGEHRSQHHVFKMKMPPGCVCRPSGWLEQPLAVCPRFEIGTRGLCRRCLHKQACHKEPAPKEASR